MANYTETKTAKYIAVSTIETPQATNIMMLPAAAVDVPPPAVDVQPPAVNVSCCKGKKMNKNKKKRCLFMCCSNMQFENAEEKEKTLAFFKGENSKLAMVMCCSNFQVGPNDEFGPKKIAK